MSAQRIDLTEADKRALGARPTKQQVIDELLAELVRISAQTYGYDEYSTIGTLHDIAHKAVVKYSKHRTKDVARESWVKDA